MKQIFTLRILFFLSIVMGVSATSKLKAQCDPDDFEALRVLYQSTDGDNWANKTGWELVRDNATPPANCDLSTLYGVTLSGGRVSEISLGRNQLSGTIPAELGNLSNLQSLVLYINQLSGTIPVELSNLSNLRTLDLGGNRLSGTIPVELSNLSNLQILSLGFNQLSGTIPVELSNLSNLQGLYLSINRLSGTIPAELGNLSNLHSLNLFRNQLSGTIPAELGNLTNLNRLFLRSNQLSGTIPAELGNLINLQYLYLDNNSLSGSIPAELGNLANLDRLLLYNNQLSCYAPELQTSWAGNTIITNANISDGNPDLKPVENFLATGAGVCGAMVEASAGPNCRDINASIDGNDMATITPGQFVTNGESAVAVDVEVKNRYGGIIFSQKGMAMDDEIKLSACAYLRDGVKINVSNGFGACWSQVTFKQSNGPIFTSRQTKKVVWCLDPIIAKGDKAPTASVPCGGKVKDFAAMPDWIMPFPCDNDTAKVIIRGWEAFDKNGHRGVHYDTLTVLKLPKLNATNFICPQRDTVYCEYLTYDNGTPRNPKDDYVCDGYPEWECADGVRVVLPKIVNDEVDPTMCDTLCLGETTLNNTKCGVIIKLEKEHLGGSCPEVVKKSVTIKQTCYGPTIENQTCKTAEDDGVTAEEGADFILCETWKMYMDTLGPRVVVRTAPDWYDYDVDGNGEIDYDNREGYKVHKYITDSHGCYADVEVPFVWVKDKCSGIKYVKARIEGVGSVEMKFGEKSGRFDKYFHDGRKLRIPHSPVPTKVYYEAYDSCHNVTLDSTYILVKDLTKPVVVMDREVTVTLSDKKVWVDAETWNEGSWDNCGVNIMLARRKDDWKKYCVDLCPAGLGDITSVEDFVKWLDKQGGLARAIHNALEDGKSPLEREVEEHYSKTIKWLIEDEGTCGRILAKSWYLSVLDYWAKNCGPVDDHGNALLDVSEIAYNEARNCVNCYHLDEKTCETEVLAMADNMRKIGGGWSKQVPFGCEDACKEVKVELLVMDYWCNWSKGWATTHVEDPQPAKLLWELGDINVSCESYVQNYKDIVDAAIAGGNSEDAPEAFAALDGIFGKYHKAWENDQHKPTDKDGNVLTGKVKWKTTYCEVEETSSKVADTLHDGTVVWNYVYDHNIVFKEKSRTADQGYVGILCEATCKEDIWPDLDHCGNGKIVRKFYVTSGCGEKQQTSEYSQTIYIYAACDINKAMFDLPASEVDVCVSSIQYDSEGNVILPASAGEVVLDPALAGKLCNRLGIGKTDKVFKVAGEDNKYKVVRRWDMIDWCYNEGFASPEDDHHEGGKIWCEQKILVTVDPDCGEGDVSSANVSGDIYTEKNEKVDKVEVVATFADGSQKTTTVNGAYNYAATSGETVNITPSKNIDHDNGVTVRDIVAIQRSLLGKGDLSSKYAKIAADVNKDGVINTKDLIDIKRLVLNKTTTFPNSPSWRFFTTDGNKESVDIKAGEAAVDFMAVKVGDVNIDNDPSRNRASVSLTAEDQVLKAGQEYSVAITSSNFAKMRGMQYTISGRGVALLGLESGALSVDGESINTTGDKMSHVWYGIEDVTLGTEEVLYTIVLRANENTTVGEALSITSDVTLVEATSADTRDMGVVLTVGESTEGVALYGNTPNPVVKSTEIGFSMAEAGWAKLSVYDVTGKVLKVVEGNYGRGYNSVVLNKSDLGATGVLFYQLDTKGFSATKKMIVIE